MKEEHQKQFNEDLIQAKEIATEISKHGIVYSVVLALSLIYVRQLKHHEYEEANQE